MREVNFLHYHPGESFYHRHDARLKVLEMALWSTAALTGGPAVLFTLFVLMAVLCRTAGVGLKHMKKPLLFWLIMAVAISLSSGLNSAGHTPSAGRLALGRDGLLRGALQALRLLTVLLAGQLFASTTDPSDMADALRRIAVFLPRRWAAALGTAVSLTISFIPRILDEGATVRDAALSRGLGERRSIFRRALALGLPLAEATLRRADLTTEALLSRCFSTSPSRAEMKLNTKDVLLTLILLAVPGLAYIIYGIMNR